jgi:hypothetical protein
MKIFSMKDNTLTLDHILSMEAYADLMIQKATEIKIECRQARIKLEGVSTSSVRQGSITEEQIAQVLARRKKLFLKS